MAGREPGSERRELAKLRRDLERFTFLVRQGDDAKAGEAAGVIAQRVLARGVPLDPTSAVAVGTALAAAERVHDATEVLRAALAPFNPDDLDTPATALRRALLSSAEESGQFSLAVEVGETLLRTPTVGYSARFQVHLLVAEAERQRGRLDACAGHLDLGAYVLNTLQAGDEVYALHAWITVLRGLREHAAGDLTTADALLREALQSPWLGEQRPLALGLAADVLVDLGDLTAAAAVLAAAEAEVPATPRSVVGTIAVVRGRMLRAAGQVDDALTALDRAEVDLVATQRAPLVARVHWERARCWGDAGRHQESTSLLRHARDEFASFGSVLEVAVIDRQLDGRDHASG